MPKYEIHLICELEDFDWREADTPEEAKEKAIEEFMTNIRWRDYDWSKTVVTEIKEEE